MKRGIVVLLMVAAFAGCKKDKGDTIKPVINVTSPTANQQFSPGQVINITAAISDNAELHDIGLSITNKGTNAELVHNHYHVDVSSYTLNDTYTAGAGITYRIKIEATDHSGNKSETEFEVKGN